MAKKRHAKRFRNNPFSLKGVTSNLSGTFKSAGVGALGIAVNKLISNQLAGLLKVQAGNKQLVELGSAVVVLPMVGKLLKMPTLANAAAAVALYEAGKKFLPAPVQTQLSGAYEFPVLPTTEQPSALLGPGDEYGLMPSPAVYF